MTSSIKRAAATTTLSKVSIDETPTSYLIYWVPHAVEWFEVVDWAKTRVLNPLWAIVFHWAHRGGCHQTRPSSECWDFRRMQVHFSNASSSLLKVHALRTPWWFAFLRVKRFICREKHSRISLMRLNQCHAFLFYCFVTDINDIFIKEVDEVISFLESVKFIEYFEHDEKTVLAFQHPFHHSVSLEDLSEAFYKFLKIIISHLDLHYQSVQRTFQLHWRRISGCQIKRNSPLSFPLCHCR